VAHVAVHVLDLHAAFGGVGAARARKSSLASSPVDVEAALAREFAIRPYPQGQSRMSAPGSSWSSSTTFSTSSAVRSASARS
jgi:hypothetical protein